MYTTSSAYKTAMRSNSRPYNTVYGTITLTDGSTVTIDGSVMPTNSITISSQCVDGEELMFGGVYSKELKLSIITSRDRYVFFDATIELYFKVQIGTSNNQPVYETIPLGIFTVVDADRNQDIVSLTADDNLMLLDGGIGANLITGNIWNIFQRIATDTGITLAFDEEDLSDFINSTYQLDISSEQGINSYRDVVKILCQLMGCFAYADREGQLALKQYSMEPDLSLTTSDWFSFVPADYYSNYIGLSVTGMAGTFSKYSEDLSEVGNVMIIEDAPAWDMGSEQSLQDRVDNLFDYLYELTNFPEGGSDNRYTPGSLEMPSDPSFDCGDRLLLTNRKGAYQFIITSIEWKFHQGMTLTSDGVNPYFNGSTSLEAAGNRMINQAIAKSRLQFLHFTNPTERIISDDTPVLITEATFTPSTDTDALFIATFLVDIDVPDVTETDTETVEVPVKVYNQLGEEITLTDSQGNPVTFKGVAENTMTYERDGKCPVTIYYTIGTTGSSEQKLPSDENPYLAIDNLEAGRHIISVNYPLTALITNTRYEFKVYMTSGGGIITIPANSTRASIFGQEITTLGKFDGVIKVEDTTFELHQIRNVGVQSLVDSAVVTITSATNIFATDTIQLYNIRSTQTIPITEGTGDVAPHIYMRGGFPLATEDGKRFTSEDSKKFLTE